jgi:dihydroneopterin aldolase
MSDQIAVRGIRAFGYHGVLPEERAQGQLFVVDAVLTVDTRSAAASDDLEQTVDYAALAQRVVALVEGDPVNLIETLAQRIADDCLKEDAVRAVEVTVHKPDAPAGVPFGDISVTIARDRSA